MTAHLDTLTSPSAPHEIALHELPLLRGLAPAARSIIAAAPRRRFRRGETLWVAGSEAQGLAIVLQGEVRVVRAPGGRQYAIHTEGAGGTLGEVPFFAGGRYPATAIATVPTICLWLDHATLGRAVAADPALALRWLGRLALRVRELVERLDRQTAQTVDQRLAQLLLERHGESRGKPFTLAATQAEAAENLGTVREVIARTLRRFRAAGLVGTTARGIYVVRDRRGLMRIATPAPRAAATSTMQKRPS